MKPRHYLFAACLLLLAVLIPLSLRYLPHAKQHVILKDKSRFRQGDIIFQVSQSRQSQAIQMATHSKYSHCGLIYINNGKYYVLEAVQPVKLTPLEQWIARGKNAHYVVKRLKDADEVLTPAVINKMAAAGKPMMKRSYDLYFNWSDERIYCSELIWKIYQRGAGIQLGRLEKLGDFDLDNPLVKLALRMRYGNNIPLNEKVISPAAIFNSPRLTTVITG